LWYNKKTSEKEGTKQLFLQQMVTPAPRGKGRQVPNHSGPTRVMQHGGRDAAGQRSSL